MTDSLRTALTDKMIKLDQYLKELKEAKPDTYSSYSSSKFTRYGIERLLQLIVDSSKCWPEK